MARCICCTMRDRLFDLIRYVILGWTFSMACIFVTAGIFNEMIAYEWTELTRAKLVNVTGLRPAMKLVNNTWANHTYYQYDTSNKEYERAMSIQNNRSMYQHALSTVIIINCAIGGIFHVMGLIGSWRLVHCLVLTFAIYMTFMSAMLFINGLVLQIYYKLIAGFASSMVTVLSFCLCSGIRERWFRAVTVGDVQHPDRDQVSNGSDDSRPDRAYKLYPDLSAHVYHIQEPNNNDGPPVPSAPPIPAHIRQPTDFSKF